jgi:hypothetical protein
VSVVTSRERYLAAQRRYNHSEKGRARYKKYRLSDGGRAAERRWIVRRTAQRRQHNIAHRTELLALPFGMLVQ